MNSHEENIWERGENNRSKKKYLVTMRKIGSRVGGKKISSNSFHSEQVFNVTKVSLYPNSVYIAKQNLVIQENGSQDKAMFQNALLYKARMCLCMIIFVCISICVCMCMCICLSAYLFICVSVYLCICVSLYLYVCV